MLTDEELVKLRTERNELIQLRRTHPQADKRQEVWKKRLREIDDALELDERDKIVKLAEDAHTEDF